MNDTMLKEGGTGERPSLLSRAKRGLAVSLCAVLCVAVACMTLALLLQALALLAVAVLAAALLLPHPLKWYAREGADAVKLFLRELFEGVLSKDTLREAPLREDVPREEGNAKP